MDLGEVHLSLGTHYIAISSGRNVCVYGLYIAFGVSVCCLCEIRLTMKCMGKNQLVRHRYETSFDLNLVGSEKPWYLKFETDRGTMIKEFRAFEVSKNSH